MRGVILGVAIAALATGASAQVTRCGEEFGKWVCRTQPSQPRAYQFTDPMEAFDRSYERSQRIMKDVREAQARRAQAQSQAADEHLAAERRRLEAVEIVKGYIAAKRCAEASRVAYEYFGDRGRSDAEALCPN